MDEVERDRQIVLAALADRGGGSALRGWRKELDPDGSLDTNFLDFCKAASRLKITVDALKLFGEDSPESLTLDELAPKEGALVNRFRKWMAEKFGSPSEMFMMFEPPEGDGKITKDIFKEECLKHGFEASDRDLSEIFNLLDANCVESVAMEDVSFLDMDEKRREGAITKARTKRKFAHEHLLTEVYRENRQLRVPTSHRLAPRGWHAPAFDQLPEVIIEKRLNWQRDHDNRCKEAGAKFRRHLQSAYGNAVRAWRRGLDPGCKFVLRRADLGRYCRTVNFDCDIDKLWKILDRDSDGALCLEDVASRAAASLANFWYWARKNYQECVLLWSIVMVEARPPPSWKSTSSLPFGSFLRALRTLGWPGIANGHGTALCNALDLYGCGIVCRTDLQWLDRWRAPDWLCREADPQAWAEFSRIMTRAYGPPLRQWRWMDKDSSNEVSWVEFQESCDEIRFFGNRGGVWRQLDKGLTGQISLSNYDLESSKIMLSFKDFVDTNFGSVEYAFKSMDNDGSGSLTFSELKRACRRMKWKGDVAHLFDCLDLDTTGGVGARSISFNELAFLDTWPMVQAGDMNEEDEKMPPIEGAEQAEPGRQRSIGSRRDSSISLSSQKPQRSNSEPLLAKSTKTLLPALKRFDSFQAGEHDPCWRKSKSTVKADILAAFRQQNKSLRSKTEQLRAEHKELEKQARAQLQGTRHLDPNDFLHLEEPGEAEEVGSEPDEFSFRPGAPAA